MLEEELFIDTLYSHRYQDEVSSKNLVACICMIDLHAGMDQKVRWIYSYDATVGSYL